jgi:hypothetical protein
MSCIRTEIFGTNYTDFALVEELELLVTARHGGNGDRNLWKRLGLSASLAYLLILLINNQYKYHGDEVAKV